MKHTAFILVTICTGLQFPVSGTALTLYTGGDYYRYDDRYDSLWNNGTDLFYNVGIGLDNVGGSGLSFHSDMLYANEFYDGVTSASTRAPLQINTGYFDWHSNTGRLGFRLGRQPFTSLAVESFDLDGFKAEVHPTAKSRVTMVAGATVPIPYTRFVWSQVPEFYDTIVDFVPSRLPRGTSKDTLLRRMPLTNKIPDQGVVAIDGSISMIPFTTLIGAIALVPKAYNTGWITSDTLKLPNPFDPASPDSVDSIAYDTAYESGDFRVALGTNIQPIPQLRFTGSGRLSMVNKGIDRYDGRLTFMPGELLEVSGYLIGERGRIDSTNYFSIMFNKPLTETGLTLNVFPDGGGALQTDYHIIAVWGEGVDHYLSFDAANRYLNGGIVLSAGWHGTSLRPYGGLTLPFGKFFSLVGSAEYARIDRAVTRRVYEFAVLSGGLKMAFRPIGLTIYPRMEYLKNRYYTSDMRLLVTAGLLFNRFWENKP